MNQIAFRYKAVDRDGSAMKGLLRARDRNEAYRQIMASGLRPVKITATGGGGARRKKRKVSAKDLAHFTYQFAVLMEARIPIGDGLRSIADQESHEGLRHVIEQVATEIEAGNAVTHAMSQFSEVFGSVYIETVRAAEMSGNMPKVLNHLADMLERQEETRKSVKSALMYPICVLSAMMLAVLFLVVFVVPRFAELFESRGVDLPLPTQVLVLTTTVVRSYWYAILGLMVGGFFLVRAAWRHDVWRGRIDRWLHKVPYLRDVLRGLAVSRFAHVFGLCLQSGIGLIEALEMSGRSCGRPMLQADAQKMKEQVNHGGRLSDVMLACPYLPGFAKRMIAAGEESAELTRMCSIVARHYDREVAHLTKNVTAVIEPIMIVGLAALVLMIALAIFLPMWNMASLI
jgi:type II secretory pathway component PulF